MPQNDADAPDDMDGTVRQGNEPRAECVVHVVWDGGGRTLALRAGERLVVGRGDDCDIVVPHPAVSRRHAAIVGGAAPMIEDLGSINGTLVGASVLRAGDRATMQPGVVARVGAAIIVVDDGSRSNDLAGPRGDWVVGPRLQTVLALAARYAMGTLSVLITGETGVGKERIAAYVHERSPRANKPLLRINCAALPEPLLESEFFGYERGAFTGAVAAKRGLLEAARGGTVFLDEIAEMPLLLQAKMLRAVEAQEVLRVGATTATSIDVRFVAATNRDLEQLAAEGRFRSDLFYRLGAAVLNVPPLRDRREEIVPMAEAFLRSTPFITPRPLSLTPDAAAALVAHDWPGNVRELRNVIERAILVCDGEHIERAHFPFASAQPPPQSAPDSPPSTLPPRELHEAREPPGGSLRRSVDAEEARQIRAALATAGGNQTRAAALLGVSRQTLLRRLEKYAMVRPRK